MLGKLVLALAVQVHLAYGCHGIFDLDPDAYTVTVNTPAGSCSAIPTSTASANTIVPTITYMTTNPDGSTHPSGSMAVVACAGIGSTYVVQEQGGTTFYTGTQLLSCVNGAWSNTNTLTCSHVCHDLHYNPLTTTVTYANGHDHSCSMALPGATASVACTTAVPAPTSGDLFEGTSTTALSSPQSYTCSSTGNWERSGATVTQVTCEKACGEIAVVQVNPDSATDDFAGLLLSAGGHIASRTTKTDFDLVNHASATANTATIPCAEQTSTNSDVEFHFIDGTSVGAISREAGTLQTMSCYDGNWFVGTVTSEATGGNIISNKYLSFIKCMSTLS